MAETDVCREVKEKYPDYEGLLTCTKSTSGPGIILSRKATKKGRPGVMATYLPVEHNQPDSAMEFAAELSVVNNQAFKFRLSDHLFMAPPLLRYDSKGRAHRNPPGNQRLSEQKIETPHFQKFDRDGNSFAYKTDKLTTTAGEQELANPVYCIMHFYEEANMDHDGDLPILEIVTADDELFPSLPPQTDPNSHVRYFA